EDFAVGLGEALVQRVGVSLVGLANDVVDMVSIALDDRHAVVGACAVDDDILQVRIALADDGPECRLDVAFAIVVGGDYADARDCAVKLQRVRRWHAPWPSVQHATLPFLPAPSVLS